MMGLFKQSKRKKAAVESEVEYSSEAIRSNYDLEEKKRNELDLGWYYSESKDEFQLAKIAESDRANHFYVIGATGTGKTKFIECLIQQDIHKRNGFGVIDPHGDLIEDIKGFLLLEYGPDEEISERVVLIDPTSPDFTVTFNPLEKIPGVPIAEQANELISAFRKIWSDSWGVRMEDLMRNSLIALSEAELTLAELPQFLTHRNVRRGILEKVRHPLAQEYFLRFDSMTDRSQITWIEPIMNKINAFFSDERIRHIFSSEKSSFSLREIMDQKKILLVKLDKGRLKDSADLLGSLLMAKIQMAAFSRSDIPQRNRVPFYLYIDEFQNFASDSFAVILSEARKYGLSLIMAHQTLTQIPEELRSLILGNTGIQVCFRLNRHDSSILAKEAFGYSGFQVKSVKGSSPKYWSLGEEWERYISEIQNLQPRECYVKHKIEGGIIQIQTVNVETAQEQFFELVEMTEDHYLKLIRSAPFGKKSLVARDEIKTSLEERLKTEIRQNVPQPESKTRDSLPVKAVRATKAKDEEDSKGQGKLPAQTSSGLSRDEIGFLEYVSLYPGLFVTQIYKNLDLSGYKGDRLKLSLMDKGTIVQEETRKGRQGRAAKVLAVTEKGKTILGKIVSQGKGGERHRHFQKMMKEQAEILGWKAIIEERIPHSLESVDVGFTKGEMKVALEISATTKPEQEIQNMRKCLDAGYDYVILTSDDEKDLSMIKREAKKSFTIGERERLRFSFFANVKGVLLRLSSPGIVSEKGIVSGQISREKQLLNPKETSEFLGIQKNTLYEWVLQKKIPHVKVGRLLRFRKADLISWLEKRAHEEEDFVG